MDALAEQMLVQQCVCGDRAAWQQLYEHYHGPLKRAIPQLFDNRAWDANVVDDIAGPEDNGFDVEAHRVEPRADSRVVIVGQAGKHEVPRFGRSQGDGYCFQIAHLADQNDIRSLPYHVSQGAGE